MTQQEIDYVKSCIRENRVHDFYVWSEWLKVREQVLMLDHHECQMCKKQGRYSPAVLVHHVNHVRDRPELALEVFTQDVVIGKQYRQLISLCKRCHEEQHPESLKRRKKRRFWTAERW